MVALVITGFVAIAKLPIVAAWRPAVGAVVGVFIADFHAVAPGTIVITRWVDVLAFV